MIEALSLDQRYLEFRDCAAPVFAAFPQLEPMRHLIFRQLVIDREATHVGVMGRLVRRVPGGHPGRVKRGKDEVPEDDQRQDEVAPERRDQK